MDTAQKFLSQLCWSRHGARTSRLVSTVVQHLQSSARAVMAGGHLLGIFGARVGAVRVRDWHQGWEGDQAGV